jgi:ABC-type lipoprotein release transport system permease subunit
MLVFKLAWRNILRHRGKSLIIGAILFLAALIMTLGSATAIGMQRGIDENMVKSFTGHIILVSNEETKDNVLFTPQAKPLKILKDYPAIADLLKTQSYVKDFIAMTRGGVMILGGNQMSFLLSFGCDLDEFQRVFGSPISTVEGELFGKNERGILINANERKRLYRTEGYWLLPEGYKLAYATLPDEAQREISTLATKSDFALEGFGEPGATNISVPIRAIYKFRSLNGAMEAISLMDIESFRTLFGYFTAAEITAKLPQREEKLLSAGEDAFLGSGDIYATGGTASASQLESALKAPQETVAPPKLDTAAYNYVSVVLKNGENLDTAIVMLKKAIEEAKLPVKVLSWKIASGQIAQSADILQSILGIFVFLLFFVAIIIIMNTLSMNAIERTEELGMMRAVGARKGFIAKMFLTETFLLSFIFGGIGIFFGVIVTWIVRAIGIGSGGNEILEIFFGGDVFKPILGGAGLVNGIWNLILVTLFAVIYPIVVARKITPLDAINRQ